MNRRFSIPAALLAILATGYLAYLATAGDRTGDPAGAGAGPGDPARESARASGRDVRSGGDATPGRPARAPVPDSARDFTQGDTAPGPSTPGTAAAAGAPGGPGAPVDPAEAAEAERIAEAMRKLVRDLEYTKGLPEPPQQTVEPQPEPWRANPEREGPPPEIAAVTPLRGRVAGGERAEIRGRNLRVVSVMFGTSPARLLEASGTLVAVEVPPGTAGPATVAVTNDDGTWGVAPRPYVYGE